MKAKLLAVLAALTSSQARPAEMLLFRLIVAALGIKLGFNYAHQSTP